MNPSQPLPELHQAELDEPTLRELFNDVTTLTELQQIIPKHAASGYVTEHEELSPEVALALLLEQKVRSLQLRYLHEGTFWWDTITPTPHGTFRIIRIQHA